MGTSTASAHASRPARDGENPLERRAVYKLAVDRAAMPASKLVQVLLWPDELAEWARQEGIDSSVLYNTLSGHKPYHDVRERLARRLGVEKRYVDALIDRPPGEPHANRPPDPPSDWEAASGDPLPPPADRGGYGASGAEPRSDPPDDTRAPEAADANTAEPSSQQQMSIDLSGGDA